jgi:endoglucanase
MKKFIFALGIIVIIGGLFTLYNHMQSTTLFPKLTHTPLVTKKYFGVTVSGPEFQDAVYTDKTYSGYSYFHQKGLTLIRMPFKWERIQPTLQGVLNMNQLNKYSEMVTSAQNAGETVIIEPHNFARFNNIPLTVNDQHNFSDLWSKIAIHFKDYSGIWGYELMNEPHDIPGDCQTWETLSQSAIDAIRIVDTTHYILVPGYSWQSAPDWQSASDCLKNLKDPANKLIYSAHEYFDEDKSGTYKTSCTDTTIGVTRAHPFLTWLEKNNKIGMFTEYGIPPDICWQTTLNKFMQTIYTNPNIIGGIYWAAGPAWGDYPLSIEPKNNTDKPQMKILTKYPTTK